MNAAFDRFARDGLAAARTSDIAVEAGVSHGAVFVHFPSREDLLEAVVDELGTRVARRIHELSESGAGVKELLEAHVQGLAEFEPLYARLVMEESVLSPRAKSAVVMIQSAISFHLSQAVERESAAGVIRDMPFHLLFNTWIGLVHHYVSHADSFAAPGQSVLKRHGPALVEHFYGLISALAEKKG